jgi:hypothetical protein
MGGYWADESSSRQLGRADAQNDISRTRQPRASVSSGNAGGGDVRLQPGPTAGPARRTAVFARYRGAYSMRCQAYGESPRIGIAGGAARRRAESRGESSPRGKVDTPGRGRASAPRFVHPVAASTGVEAWNLPGRSACHRTPGLHRPAFASISNREDANGDGGIRAIIRQYRA